MVWLLVLIGLDYDPIRLYVVSKESPRMDDRRAIRIDINFTKDWIKAAKRNGKGDIWTLAERIVKERKKGVSELYSVTCVDLYRML